MKIESTLEKAQYNMFMIPLSDEEGSMIIEKFGKRVICSVNKTKFHCAIQTSKNLGYFIGVGKNTKKMLNIEFEDKLELNFEKDQTKFKAKMPEELEIVLETDPDASYYFEQLTDGRKRSIIHYISKAKQTQTRVDRSLKIAEKLKFGITDLKEMLKAK